MIDLKKLKEELTTEDIIELVTYLGADRYNQKGDTLMFPTICHNESSEDASLKLYYYDNSKLFKCYTGCPEESFDIYALFEKRYKLLNKEYDYYKDIVLIIAKNKKIVEVESKGFSSKYESDFSQYNSPNIVLNIPPVSKKVLKAFTFYPTVEWLSDGISEDAMKTYNILYSVDGNKIIIPHYNEDNDLIGIRGRNLNDEDIAYGKYTPVKIEGKMYSHPLSYNLYGLNVNKENIERYRMAIVAESEKAVLQYHTMFGKDKNICCAVCGSVLQYYQVELLLRHNVDKILIAFDKEGETWKEQQEYYNKLKNFCMKYRNKVEMGFIYDSQNLLNLKDSPFDKGKDIFLKLYKGANWF